MDAQDEALLRQSALRTWRVFREFSTAEENWLVPDLIQEPASLMIHNISTTNLGLLMNSRLAATDLGFLTVPEFVADTERTFDSDRPHAAAGERAAVQLVRHANVWKR